MSRVLLIGLGAALGANARYFVGIWAGSRFGAQFPYGTLLVNVTGSFLLGFFLTAATGRFNISPEVRLLIAVGFLGSYTTFSSFSVESLNLLRAGTVWPMVVNVLGNNVIGLVFALWGIYLANLIG